MGTASEENATACRLDPPFGLCASSERPCAKEGAAQACAPMPTPWSSTGKGRRPRIVGGKMTGARRGGGRQERQQHQRAHRRRHGA